MLALPFSIKDPRVFAQCLPLAVSSTSFAFACVLYILAPVSSAHTASLSFLLAVLKTVQPFPVCLTHQTVSLLQCRIRYLPLAVSLTILASACAARTVFLARCSTRCLPGAVLHALPITASAAPFVFRCQCCICRVCFQSCTSWFLLPVLHMLFCLYEFHIHSLP